VRAPSEARYPTRRPLGHLIDRACAILCQNRAAAGSAPVMTPDLPACGAKHRIGKAAELDAKITQSGRAPTR